MLEKENLIFTINDNNYGYQGLNTPEARQRDLFGLLIKVHLDRRLVPQAFRDNLHPFSHVTDEQIYAMYNEALEKKRHRLSTKSSSKTNNIIDNGFFSKKNNNEAIYSVNPQLSSYQPEEGERGMDENNTIDKDSSYRALFDRPVSEGEQPQKLTLTIQGKVFAYEGLPSQHPAALLEFLAKQPQQDPALIEAAFRDNLDEAAIAGMTGNEMVSFVEKKIQQRLARKALKKKKKGDAIVCGKTTSDALSSTVDLATSSSLPEGVALHQSSSPGGTHPISGTTSAIINWSAMSANERNNLNDFIKEVLNTPADTRIVPVQNGAGVMSSTISVAPSHTSPPSIHYGETFNEQTLVQQQQESARSSSLNLGESYADSNNNFSRHLSFTGDKYAVYCNEENDKKVVKVIPASKNITFTAFKDLVEKKYGQKIFMYFYEGSDKIEIDCNDVLQMFFEQANGGAKLRLTVAPLKDREVDKKGDDHLTSDGFGIATNAIGVVIKTSSKLIDTSQFSVKHCEVKSYSGHTGAVYCVSWAPDGKCFASSSRDRSVRLWNIETGTFKTMKGGHSGFVLCCDFSPDGNRIVSGCEDASMKVWDVKSCNKLLFMKGHEDKVYCVKYNKSGAFIVSGGCDRAVCVWCAEKGESVAVLRGHSLSVFTCNFSNTDAGKYVVSGSDDRLIKVWDWRWGNEVKNFIGHTGTIWSVCFSNNDKYIASASMAMEVNLWHVADMALVRSIEAHKTPIHQVLFSCDDKYMLSCARDWTVMVWETITGKHCDTLTGHKNTVFHMDLRDDMLLTCGLDMIIKLWKMSFLRLEK